MIWKFGKSAESYSGHNDRTKAAGRRSVMFTIVGVVRCVDPRVWGLRRQHAIDNVAHILHEMCVAVKVAHLREFVGARN